MADSIPPDPYKALGLTSEATSSAIKSAYRKAALRCHPDKAQDKASAADEFHKIQQAYEILVDDEKRARYDDSIRLAQLRRDVHEQRRGSGGHPGSAYSTATPGRSPYVEVRTASYDFRPGPTQPGNFSARGPSRVYEERRPPHGRPFDEDFARYEAPDENRSSSRKFPTAYEPSPRRPPPPRHAKSEDIRQGSRPERVSPKVSQRDRAESKRQREREKDSGRKSKYAASLHSGSDDDDDEVSTFMGGPSRKTRKDDVDVERARYDGRKGRASPSVQSSDEDPHTRKMRDQMANIKDYIGVDPNREKRGNKSKSPPREYRSAFRQDDDYEPREPRRRTPSRERKESKSSRPGFFRRMSSKPNNDSPAPNRTRSATKDSGRRRSKTPESPERGDINALNSSRNRQPPKLFTSMSQPSNIKEARSADPRSTRTVDDYAEKATPPRVKRADSMPAESSTPRRPPLSSTRSPRSSSRQTPTRSASTIASAAAERERERETQPSNLRNQPHNDSGYSTSSESNEPSVAPQPKTTKYRYGDPADKPVQDSSPELPQGAFTPSFREPPPSSRGDNQNRRFHRSPSPLTRGSPAATAKPSPHVDSGRDSGRESGRDAQRAPPLSRSATDTKNIKKSSSSSTSQPASRRPSLTKTESTPATRRTTSSSRNNTASSKEQSFPFHMKTGSASFNNGLGISTPSGQADQPILFGEYRRSASPPEYATETPPPKDRSRRVSEDGNLLSASAAKASRSQRDKDTAPTEASARRNKQSRGASGNGSRENLEDPQHDARYLNARAYMEQQEREAAVRPWEKERRGMRREASAA